MYYVVDDKLKDWVMGSAAKKWRDFKSELKTLYFDEKMTDEELQVVPDNRVSPTDWKELVAFWKTEAGKVRCKKIHVHFPAVLPNLQFIESIFVAT